MDNDIDVNKAFAERYKELPPVVQRAIDSADVEEHLRSLAKTHNLHIDQWQVLENEVMLTLFGFAETSKLAENIKNEVVVTEEVAKALAADISKVVFEPIRIELEQQLDHPTAAAQSETAIEATRRAALEAVTPATPPPPANTEKAVRAPIAPSYTATPSHERKQIVGDPYREQP